METKLVNGFLAVLVCIAIISSVGRIAQYNAKHEIVTSRIALPYSNSMDHTAILRQEATCLAENIYHEARNQSVRGQLAVASVTLNRVYSKKFPNTICGVVYQKNRRGCQFSWLCKHRWVDEKNPLFNEKYKMAMNILTGQIEIESLNNAVYYHASYVRPWWARYKAFVEQIGAHKFYREKSA